MHPYDVANPPSGAGWVIQIVCHHYNPYPKTKEQIALSPKDPRRTDFGPYQFITEKVLTKLKRPDDAALRRRPCGAGVDGAGTDWTTEKGSQHNNLASNTVPSARSRVASGLRRWRWWHRWVAR